MQSEYELIVEKKIQTRKKVELTVKRENKTAKINRQKIYSTCV